MKVALNIFIIIEYIFFILFVYAGDAISQDMNSVS